MLSIWVKFSDLTSCVKTGSSHSSLQPRDRGAKGRRHYKNDGDCAEDVEQCPSQEVAQNPGVGAAAWSRRGCTCTRHSPFSIVTPTIAELKKIEISAGLTSMGPSFHLRNHTLTNNTLMRNSLPNTVLNYNNGGG